MFVQDRNSAGKQVAAVMLSALLTTGAAFAPQQLQLTQSAHADEESSSLSPFEKRKADLARRRELLQQAYGFGVPLTGKSPRHVVDMRACCCNRMLSDITDIAKC